MNPAFWKDGVCFKRAVDEVLYENLNYSDVIDIKVATVFLKAR